MPVSTVEAAERIEQMIALTARLTDQLAIEAQAFEARRPHEVAAQVEETAKLANLYRHEAGRLKSNRELVLAADAEARLRLMRVTEAFEAVLARHGRALAAAKFVTEGLVQAIAREVSEQRGKTAAYGADGRSGAGDATAITLNRRA
jgi:hypothetical protein